MRTEAVRAQLAAHGLGDRYREFTVTSAPVALAAAALHWVGIYTQIYT